MQDVLSSLSQAQINNKKKEKGEMEAKLIKEMDGGDIVSIKIDDMEFEFVGNIYKREHDWTNWPYGVCPDCKKLDGRTSIYAKDYCFCLEHMKAWAAGINCWGKGYKEKWYAEEKAVEKNERFLRVFEEVEGEFESLAERLRNMSQWTIRQDAIQRLYRGQPISVGELKMLALIIPPIDLLGHDDCVCAICPEGAWSGACCYPPDKPGDKDSVCLYYLGSPSDDREKTLCGFNLKDSGIFDDEQRKIRTHNMLRKMKKAVERTPDEPDEPNEESSRHTLNCRICRKAQKEVGREVVCKDRNDCPGSLFYMSVCTEAFLKDVNKELYGEPAAIDEVIQHKALCRYQVPYDKAMGQCGCPCPADLPA